MTQSIYFFSKEFTDGDALMKNTLGGKGANLAQMCRIGLPVPPGFTIAAHICAEFYKNNSSLPQVVLQEIPASVKKIESITGKSLGGEHSPLLLSIRSGAVASMPGMMDTILNLGMNDKIVKIIASETNNPRFAYDCYRRFIQMFCEVALGMDGEHFEHLLSNRKRIAGANLDCELTEQDLKNLIEDYKKYLLKNNVEFPQDPLKQLELAICAVFKSWMNPRAQKYREIHNIDENVGTAVNIQAMVFGNFGNDSATGVCFSRNPSTGENKIYGEYLINAQGEDVVAGIRTPAQISIDGKIENYSEELAMEEVMPALFKELCNYKDILEGHYKDLQDIEFTIEQGKLWILQTRNAKRSAQAALKIAVDLASENIIAKTTALSRITPQIIDKLLHPTIQGIGHKVIGKGLPASPGAVSGKIAFDSKRAEMMAKHDKVILARIETSPEDIVGMHSSVGIITARGGMTSHAAVVARGMGKTCVVSVAGLEIDYTKQTMKLGANTFHEGDVITINGSNGDIYIGEIPTHSPRPSPEFITLMSWANQIKKLKVFANADTPKDAKIALEMGAQGIGLCRTEHMFFDKERIISMRKMIMASSCEARELALAELLPYQKADFKAIFEIMAGLPVTIRLLDPPLHEFLPHEDFEIAVMATALNTSVEEIKNRMDDLKEINPMLGHRGCRLAITYPEIYQMQARAIFEAMIESNFCADVEIMIPLVINEHELKYVRTLIEEQAALTFKGKDVKYKIGTMIELPKAALNADKLAAHADFFSFGTNDLTQSALGLSRDDSSRFMPEYLNKGILQIDPFEEIDQEGVGELIKIACYKAINIKKDIKIGVCGEHAGNYNSILFFGKIEGLSYISCSPYRIPIAILAAANG